MKSIFKYFLFSDNSWIYFAIPKFSLSIQTKITVSLFDISGSGAAVSLGSVWLKQKYCFAFQNLHLSLPSIPE